MLTLLDFFKAKVFNAPTQCTICGAENAWFFDRDFSPFSNPIIVTMFCGNCYKQESFDVTRVCRKLNIDWDDLEPQFIELRNYINSLPRVNPAVPDVVPGK